MNETFYTFQTPSEAEVFTLNTAFFTIQELDVLFGALNYVFQQCEAQLRSYVAA